MPPRAVLRRVVQRYLEALDGRVAEFLEHHVSLFNRAPNLDPLFMFVVPLGIQFTLQLVRRLLEVGTMGLYEMSDESVM